MADLDLLLTPSGPQRRYLDRMIDEMDSGDLRALLRAALETLSPDGRTVLLTLAGRYRGAEPFQEEPPCP